MEAIGPEKLADRLERREDLFVLDLRHEAEFASYNIDGSYNAPVYHELTTDGEALEPYLADLPADAQIVTVCRIGACATDATRALEDRGYEAVTLRGGIRNWRGYSEGTLAYRLKRAIQDRFF